MVTALQVVNFIFQADPRFVWNRNLLEELIETKVILFEENTNVFLIFLFRLLTYFYTLLQLDEFITPLIQGNILKFQKIPWKYNTVVTISALVTVYCVLAFWPLASPSIVQICNAVPIICNFSIGGNMLQELVHPWLFYVFRQSNLPWRID